MQVKTAFFALVAVAVTGVIAQDTTTLPLDVPPSIEPLPTEIIESTTAAADPTGSIIFASGSPSTTIIIASTTIVSSRATSTSSAASVLATSRATTSSSFAGTVTTTTSPKPTTNTFGINLDCSNPAQSKCDATFDADWAKLDKTCQGQLNATLNAQETALYSSVATLTTVPANFQINARVPQCGCSVASAYASCIKAACPALPYGLSVQCSSARRANPVFGAALFAVVAVFTLF
ncbi:hypothetical protein HDU96_005065 [Phlyctochytrium bullatum]|nr:hypothetical protein HDU96_005065 [Phlyctochytrium bullatum]